MKDSEVRCLLFLIIDRTVNSNKIGVFSNTDDTHEQPAVGNQRMRKHNSIIIEEIPHV